MVQDIAKWYEHCYLLLDVSTFKVHSRSVTSEAHVHQSTLTNKRQCLYFIHLLSATAKKSAWVAYVSLKGGPNLIFWLTGLWFSLSWIMKYIIPPRRTDRFSIKNNYRHLFKLHVPIIPLRCRIRHRTGSRTYWVNDFCGFAGRTS